MTISNLNSFIVFLIIFIPIVLAIQRLSSSRQSAQKTKEKARVETLSPEAFASEFHLPESTYKQLHVAAWVTTGAGILGLLGTLAAFGNAFMDLTVPLGTSMIRLVAALMTLLGGLAMLRFQPYRAAILGSILLMIPYYGPWGGILLPLGAWNLFLLLKPPVRNLFKGTASIVES